MPIYEYECLKCKRISSFLVLRAKEEEIYCKYCGSKEVKRILSRVSLLKGEEKRMESLLDPSKLSDFDEKDPRSVERFVKRIGKELGEDVSDFEEIVEEAEKESIEEEL